jgi:hypothetical protein
MNRFDSQLWKRFLAIAQPFFYPLEPGSSKVFLGLLLLLLVFIFAAVFVLVAGVTLGSQYLFPEFFNSYKIIKNEDLIFCLYDIQETPRTIGISQKDGMITGSYNVYQTNQNPKFIYYWYLNIDDVKGLKPFYTTQFSFPSPILFRR